jgi:hypothetical protein
VRTGRALALQAKRVEWVKFRQSLLQHKPQLII